MDKTLEEVKQKIALAMEQTMRVYGLPQSVARIYAILYISDTALTFDEIETAAGHSRATVNNALRGLVEKGSVLKYWDKDSHKNQYVVERDFFKNFPAFIVDTMRKERQAYMRVAEQVRPQVEELAKDANHPQKDEVARILADMQQAVHFYEWLNRFADFLETGKVFESLPKDI